MATHRMSILSDGVQPSDSNARLEAFDNFDTTTRTAFGWVFDADTDGEINGAFMVPKNWVSGSTNFIVVWTTTGTSGNFDMEALHRSSADAGRADTNTSGATRTDTLIAAAPGTAGEWEHDTISVTDTDWAVDEMVQWQFRRDADDLTNDTLAAEAFVWDILVEYVDA